ncbi:MAG TPA: CaiB/BaiF CoA-transferase family protein [Dehalococcoidales bacterium]|nr:CaiB/BaiF CoA-transferase family protein [Dehalococcoidales bacterium]
MTGPLDGIRVLDLTQVLFGPFATMLLSDLGAEVIKIERPEVGDIARGNGPVVRGQSTYFLSLNRGKQSVTLNLATERGVEIFLKLVKSADVLVENFKPGTMEKLGLGYERVREHNPRIIYVAGSGFGQYGPYAGKPAFDVIVQAMGGVMSITGEEGGPPVRPGVSYGDITAGLFLCIATLAALQERHASGEGQFVDISMLDCQVTAQENAFVRYLNTGEIPRALGTRHPVITPFQAFQTKDGYIALALRGGIKDQWPLFCAAIDRVDIIDDPRFEDGWLRTQNYQALESILTDAMKTRTTREWVEELERADIPCGPVNNIEQAASDPQIKARGMIINVRHPEAGNFRVVNSPFKFSRTPCKVERASPDLGQHTQDVLSRLLGMSHQEIVQLKDSGVI